MTTLSIPLPQNSFEIESNSILALGADPTVARACLMETVNGRHRLISWQEENRLLGGHLSRQFEQITKKMGLQLGRRLWDHQESRPLFQSDTPVRTPPLLYVVTAATPRPVLKVWLMGLDPEHSLAAAASAMAASPARIIGRTALSPSTSGSNIGSILTTAQPNVVVVSGGYEGKRAATYELIVRLCRLIGDGIMRLSPSQYPVVVYAGNGYSADAAETILRAAAPSLTIKIVANVQPTPYTIQYAPLAGAVSNTYQTHNQKTSAYHQLSEWVTPPARIMSMETSFIRLVQSWRIYQQLPELHGLYRTADQWFHVWVQEEDDVQGDSIQTLYTSPGEVLPTLAKWPALQLVSGVWPQRQWKRPDISWCDPSGMAPIVAAVGQVSPQAMLQVLDEDLLY